MHEYKIPKTSVSVLHLTTEDPDESANVVRCGPTVALRLPNATITFVAREGQWCDVTITRTVPSGSATANDLVSLPPESMRGLLLAWMSGFNAENGFRAYGLSGDLACMPTAAGYQISAHHGITHPIGPNPVGHTGVITLPEAATSLVADLLAEHYLASPVPANIRTRPGRAGAGKTTPRPGKHKRPPAPRKPTE